MYELHRVLNSSQSVLTGVLWLYALKNVTANWAIKLLIASKFAIR